MCLCRKALSIVMITAALAPMAMSFLRCIRRGTSCNSSSRLFSIETHYPRTWTSASSPSLEHAQKLFAPREEQTAAARSRESLAPIIHHLRAERGYTCLAEFVVDETNLPRGYVDELIRFGAVYLATPVEPRVSSVQPKGTFLPSGRGTPGMRDANMSRASRAVSDGRPVPKGSYSRVHLNPRRYLRVYEVEDWVERVIDSKDDIVFVDKPAGVPMIPTVDNNVENVYSQLCAALHVGGAQKGGISRQMDDLHCLGRLDACTSGVCAFATSRRASATYHAAIAARRVTKTYKLLCSGSAGVATPVDGQLVQHLFRRRGGGEHEDAKPVLLGAYDERLLEERDSLGFAVWQEAALRIVSARAVDRGELDTHLVDVMLAASGAPRGGALFECEVQLLTGRTHQIRLQFSALGLPLVGDSRYGPAAGLLYSSDSPAASSFGPDPTDVCLQSYSLRFLDLQREAMAKFEPIWRRVASEQR